jgi:hypothetical protein
MLHDDARAMRIAIMFTKTVERCKQRAGNRREESVCSWREQRYAGYFFPLKSSRTPAPPNVRLAGGPRFMAGLQLRIV